MECKGARKSKLYITFGDRGHHCANYPRTGLNEGEACAAEPFSRSQNEKRRRATEMVTAPKINSEQPCRMGKTLKEPQKEVVEIYRLGFR